MTGMEIFIEEVNFDDAVGSEHRLPCGQCLNRTYHVVIRSVDPQSIYPPPPESRHLMCYVDQTSNLLPTPL